MNPQGSQIVNLDYFNQAAAEVNACQTCADLQAVVNRLLPQLEAVKNTVVGQLSAMGPMLALLTVPTNPTQVVTWVGNYISQILTPQLKPAITYASQLTALTAQIAEITAAISAAESKLPGCTLTGI